MADRSASWRSRSRSQNARENISRERSHRRDVSGRPSETGKTDYAQHGRASRRGREGHAIDRQHAGYYRAGKCNPGPEEDVRGTKGTKGRHEQGKLVAPPGRRKHFMVEGDVSHFLVV